MNQTNSSIMAIAAHADDLELHAAGTFLNYIQKGYNPVYIMTTNNMSGRKEMGKQKSMPLPPDEMAELRRKEAIDAADLYGVTPIFLDFRQRHYWEGDSVVDLDSSADLFHGNIPGKNQTIITAPDHPECIHLLSRLFIKHQPSLILTHGPFDQDVEHFCTSVLVKRAYEEAKKNVFLGPVWAWAPGTSGEQISFEPDIYVDISEVYEMKWKALMFHKSQINNVRKQLVQSRAEYYGRKIGVLYAEGFKILINDN